MMDRVQWQVGFIAALATLFAISACSDDDGEVEKSFDCGPGTVLEGGECVVADHDCPEDEVASPLGRCEDPDVFCGEGSAYDVDDEACVSLADVSCGEGTVEENGVCRVEDPLHCGQGTVLADEECVLEASVCGPGTELEAPHCEIDEDAACDGRTEWDVETGRCVDLGAVECGENTVKADDACVPLTSFADELAADADIDYRDELPIEISDDEPFVFTGTMDDELSHTFEFDGDTGTWLQIGVYPRGLPSPGLQVREVIGSWEHNRTPGLSSQPSVTAKLPHDDAFELTVSTFLNESDHPEASGDSSWHYVGTVEVIEAPEPVEWEDLELPMAGDFSAGEPQFLNVDTSEIDEILFTTTDIGADVDAPRVEIWHGADHYAGDFDLDVGEREEIDVTDRDEVYLYFAAVELLGPRTEFSVDATATETMPPGGFFLDEFSAEAGEVIFLSHRSASAEPVAVTVWRDQEEKFHLDEILAENQSSYTADETTREFFYVPEDGDYLVEFQNTGSEAIEGFVSTSVIGDIPTFEVPDSGPGEFEAEVEAEDLERGDWRFALIKTPSAGVFDITITAGSGNPRASVFDTERNELVSTSGSLGVAEMSVEVAEAGAYFVVSRPWSSFTPVSDGLTFEIEGESVDTLGPGEVHQQSYDAEAFDVFLGDVSYASGEAIEMRLSNPHGKVIFETSHSDGRVEVASLFPGPGEFTLEVENTGDEPLIGFDVDLDVVTPRDLLSIDAGFSENYTLDALDAGQREVVIVQSQIDLLLDVTAIFSAGEQAEIRVWDVDESAVQAEEWGEEFTGLERTFTEGLYVVELRGITALEQNSHLGLSGWEIDFVDSERVHDPAREIPHGYDENSALSVSGCTEILDVSVAMDMPSGVASQLYIDLHTPALDDPIALRAGDWGSLTTVYPDDTEPTESLDDLVGTSANGVWLVDIDNQSCCTDASLASWSVHLTCVK